MKKYKPTQLLNNGNKCWRNSLLQALLNCDYFTDQLCKQKLTKLGTSIKHIYLSIMKGEQVQAPYGVFDDINEQQCAIDYFDQIVDNVFSDKIETVFNLRYNLQDECSNISQEMDFNMVHWNENIDLNYYVFQHVLSEVCKKHKNHDANILYTLTKVKPVIAVANANKYKKIPTCLFFKNGKVKYELISAVVYNGTGKFGHYTCWVRRNGVNYITNDTVISETPYLFNYYGDAVLLLYQYSTS